MDIDISIKMIIEKKVDFQYNSLRIIFGGGLMNRTKKAIIDIFWQLLEEKPYNKITVQSIVERCQINRNTFYYHFQDIPTLVECSIQEWVESVINKNCQLGSPANCIIPVAKELINRKAAFIHLYHSANRESLMRYLNKTSQRIVQFYIDNATKCMAVPAEDRLALTKCYKCAFVGVIIDWLDNGASYDLSVFCEKILTLFAGSGERAFLMHSKEAISR